MALPVLLLTRPHVQSRDFLDACEAALGGRIDALVTPVLEIVPLGESVDLGGLGGVIFTSANAVSAIGDAAGASGLRAWCVGDQTARAARAAGFDAIAAGGDAEALVARVVEDRPKGPLLHLSGVHLAADIAGELSAAGIPATSQAVYDQVARPLPEDAAALLSKESRRVILPIFSPRSARLIRQGVPEVGKTVVPLAISAKVAAAWGESPRPPEVARTPDAESMVALVVDALRKESTC